MGYLIDFEKTFLKEIAKKLQIKTIAIMYNKNEVAPHNIAKTVSKINKFG